MEFDSFDQFEMPEPPARESVPFTNHVRRRRHRDRDGRPVVRRDDGWGIVRVGHRAHGSETADGIHQLGGQFCRCGGLPGRYTRIRAKKIGERGTRGTGGRLAMRARRTGSRIGPIPGCTRRIRWIRRGRTAARVGAWCLHSARTTATGFTSDRSMRITAGVRRDRSHRSGTRNLLIQPLGLLPEGVRPARKIGNSLTL